MDGGWQDLTLQSEGGRWVAGWLAQSHPLILWAITSPLKEDGYCGPIEFCSVYLSAVMIQHILALIIIFFLITHSQMSFVEQLGPIDF